jgi:hypothetical protein
VFIRREDAFAVLEDLLGNEPEPEALLSVVPIELPPAGFGRIPRLKMGGADSFRSCKCSAELREELAAAVDADLREHRLEMVLDRMAQDE